MHSCNKEGRNYITFFPKNLEEEETNRTLSIYETELERSLQVSFSIMQIITIVLCLVLVMMFHAAGDEDIERSGKR